MKKSLSILLALLMLVQLIPFAVLPAAADELPAAETREVYTTLESAAAAVRAQMVRRNSNITVDVSGVNASMRDIYEEALKHTGVPTEGDYILRQHQGAQMSSSGQTVRYTVSYYTTAAQENVVSSRVQNALNGMSLVGKTTEQKIRQIHDYICAHVDYEDSASDMLPHTAYGALVNGKSVCQGYAVLFYRMALECGIDCRFIPGSTSRGTHAWNIVKIGNYYYNIDVTWDDTTGTNDYYLRGSRNFSDHTRDSAYNTAAFQQAYPMSESDYSADGSGDNSDNGLPFTDVPKSAYYYDPVKWAVENGVTNGTSKTTFSPNDTCTRGQIVTFLWRAMGSATPSSSYCRFNDVKQGTYYYNAVLWAVEHEITTGTSSTTFSPDNGCTRGQVVTFLWRAKGKPGTGESTPLPSDDDELPVIPIGGSSSGTGFTDVSQNAYYYSAVQWAVAAGVTNGTSKTTFSPNDTCTRGQIVTFLYRAEHAEPSGTQTPTEPQEPSSQQATAEELELLRLINEERAKLGRNALTFNSALYPCAVKRAEELVERYDHTRPDGTSCFTVFSEYGIVYQTAAENIFWASYRATPQEIHNAFMNSQGHRDNRMNGSFTSTALRIFYKNGNTYAVELFLG